jgi:hypothetical protein
MTAASFGAAFINGDRTVLARTRAAKNFFIVQSSPNEFIG